MTHVGPPGLALWVVSNLIALVLILQARPKDVQIRTAHIALLADKLVGLVFELRDHGLEGE